MRPIFPALSILTLCAAAPWTMPARVDIPCPAATRPSQDTAHAMAAIRAAAAATGGTVGVHAQHLESGRALGVNDGGPFFMSSVTKLPISTRILRQVGRGRIRLADSVHVSAAQMAPGRSPIRDAHPGGATLTVEALLRAAIRQSDNTASDALLRLTGGPDSVNAELRRLGIAGIRVSRPYVQLGREVGGRIAAADTRDTATPGAMTALLAALYAGRLLRPAETRLLLGWMTDSENPRTRIIAGVPAGTAVAHKTGTWGNDSAPGPAAMNDVGIVTLPGGRGHLALAVFIRNATVPDSAAEAAIASIARAAFQHWAGTSSVASPPAALSAASSR